jgi:hypothetical protein
MSLKEKIIENTQAVILGIVFFVIVVILMVMIQDFSSSKFIYVDF